jgi:hypothetical protein
VLDIKEGDIYFNSALQAFRGYSNGSWGSLGGGTTVDRVTQASHSFTVGQVLYLNGSTYTLAIATSAAASEVIGMVSRVIDANTFEMTTHGEVFGLTGLTTGEAYFLSSSSAGAITVTEPTTLGEISMPVGVASSTTTFYVSPKRGIVVGGTNARSVVSLADNSTTNVQLVSAYDAGEISGWVYIDGTTDYRFHVSAPFVKNGAGSDYTISPVYVGDTPPVGFNITITSGGQIQAVMPTIAGFLSASMNFALNAPAVGATFPLSIESTLVNFSVLKAKDSSGFVFQENGATQIGSISDSGAWIFNPQQSLNYNGPVNLINGASIMAGTPTSTNTDQAGALEIGSNVYRGSAGNRFSTVTGGIGIQLINRTTNSVSALSFVSNLAGDGLTTGVSVIGSATQAGAWILGSTSFTANSFHTIQGTCGLALSYGSGATGIGANCFYDSLRNYNRTGTATNGAAIIFDANVSASSTAVTFVANQAGDATSTAADVVGSITGNGAWILGNSTLDVNHLIANNSTTQDTLNVRNYDTSTSSDDQAPLSIIKGSTTNSTSQVLVHFAVSAGGTGQGQINGNGANAAAFGTFSDARLKENIENLPSQLSNIMSLRPVEFDYKTGGHQIGFIAQEMQEIYPDAVGANKDGILSITGWDKTTARLVKAIQELKSELDEAKAEIELLKNQ